MFFQRPMGFFDAFLFSSFNYRQTCIHLLVSYILLLKTAPKTQNTSKFTKEQDMFAKLTIDGVQHQFNKNRLDRQKMGFLRNTSRTSCNNKNPNLYPHQSIITLHTLLWDTLYMSEKDNFASNFSFNYQTNVFLSGL